jgi:hypothetical protein
MILSATTGCATIGCNYGVTGALLSGRRNNHEATPAATNRDRDLKRTNLLRRSGLLLTISLGKATATFIRKARMRMRASEPAKVLQLRLSLIHG